MGIGTFIAILGAALAAGLAGIRQSASVLRVKPRQA